MPDATTRKQPRREMTLGEFQAEARRRFGEDVSKWRFVCPACGHVASVQDWRDAGAPEGGIAFSCVGRWLDEARDAFEGDGPGPCNYAGGGLFGLNPVRIVDQPGLALFDFAAAPGEECP